jgi:hypothetical protein
MIAAFDVVLRSGQAGNLVLWTDLEMAIAEGEARLQKLN